MKTARNNDSSSRMLVTAEACSRDLGGNVRVALGPSPTGPFRESYVLSLVDCPIGGFDPERPPITYGIKAHPELSSDDALLVSVIMVPARADTSGPEHTRYYVPRFLQLPWVEIFGYRRSSPDRCAP